MFIFFTIQIVPLMKSSCLITSPLSLGSPCAESACQSRRQRRYGFDPWVEKIPWSRKQQPTWNLLEFLNVLFPPHEKEKTLAWEYYNYFTETDYFFLCLIWLYTLININMDFSGGSDSKEFTSLQESQVQSLNWEDTLGRKWQPTPVFLPGEFHGQWSLAGYSPWGCKEMDITEQVSLYINMVIHSSSKYMPFPALRTPFTTATPFCLSYYFT